MFWFGLNRFTLSVGCLRNLLEFEIAMNHEESVDGADELIFVYLERFHIKNCFWG